MDTEPKIDLSSNFSGLQIDDSEKPHFPPIQFPPNGIVIVYNQYPRRYPGGFPEMIADLPRIAKMGYNAIWINPIQLPGAGRKNNGAQGSLYAMGDDVLFNDDFFPGVPNHSDRVKLVQQYTSIARALGMIPMFDLVLNHVGRDSRLETKLRNYLKKDGELTGKEKSWSDTRPFKYQDSSVQDAVIEQLWKPFIEKYIRDYGFAGIRVDAITNVNAQLQKKAFDIVFDCCQEYNKTQPVILGELMVKIPTKHITKLQNLGYTHIFSCGSIYRNFKDYAPDKNYSAGECWLISQAQQLQEIIWPNKKQDITITGGPAGILGNHDVGTLKAIVILNLEGKEGESLHYALHHHYPTKDQSCAPQMCERMLRLFTLCNGGGYLLAGDEFGILHRPTVFNDYHEPKSPTEKWGGVDDISMQISCVNTALHFLPTSQYGDSSVQKRIIVDGQPLEISIKNCAADKNKYVICLSHQPLNQENVLKALVVDDVVGNKCKIFFINHDQLLQCDFLNNQNQFDLCISKELEKAKNGCLQAMDLLIKQKTDAAYSELIEPYNILVNIKPSQEKNSVLSLLAGSLNAVALQAKKENDLALAARAHFYAGNCYLGLQQTAFAMDEFATAIKLLPSIESLGEQNKLLSFIAESLVSNAIQAGQANEFYTAGHSHWYAADCYLTLKQPLLAVQEFMAAANAFLKSNNYNDAQKVLSNATDAISQINNPNDIPKLYNMAKYLNQMGFIPHAFDCFYQLTQLDPHNPAALLNYGLQATNICMNFEKYKNAVPVKFDQCHHIASINCLKAADIFLFKKNTEGAEIALKNLFNLYQNYTPHPLGLTDLEHRFIALSNLYESKNQSKMQECYDFVSQIRQMKQQQAPIVTPTSSLNTSDRDASRYTGGKRF